MSLDSLVNLAKGSELKFLFVGGKGGVGKTTSSSAIASLLATSSKKRVLLVSTDPAHSLGDAWKTSFSNVPTSPMPNLDVMEVDPKETMEAELATWVKFAKELEGGEEGNEDSKILQQVSQFQDWITGIPGIDEATALSSAITYIESGKYDLIVFDTAPTGHTLKLLALPAILEKGIEKLESWQTTIWGYWEAFKGLTSASGTKAKKKVNMKEEISQKLIKYKESIQKVGSMLQDQERTRFVVVCIAEFLSISETKRLLQELKKNKVRASHVIVNQLVVKDALSREELNQLESMAEVGNLQMNQILLKKTIHACRLTTARKDIQHKYLAALKSCEETREILEGICEVPLLAEEVTGIEALSRFSKLLVTNSFVTSNEEENGGTSIVENSPSLGDVVRIMGLEKSPNLNGLEGKIISDVDMNTGRYGVSIVYQGKTKSVALQPKNISIVRAVEFPEPSKKQPRLSEAKSDTLASDESGNDSNPISQNTMNKAMTVLEDPEVKEMIEQNPRVKAAVEDVIANPANFMKYLSDPELSPFIMKAVSKLNV